jgi:hypothetical protein
LFPKSLINKCPAIILAVSRTASEIGRIILLINSINTINGISIVGVPIGTICINILFVLLIQPYNIIDIQIVDAILKETTK